MLSKIDGANLAVLLSGGPGCGKSRALQELPGELQRLGLQQAVACHADDSVCAFFDSSNAIALGTALVNGRNGGNLLADEKKLTGEAVVAVRALHSALRTSMSYGKFFRLVQSLSVSIGFGDVLSFVAFRRHDSSARSQRPMFVTFVIDEVQDLLVTEYVLYVWVPWLLGIVVLCVLVV